MSEQDKRAAILAAVDSRESERRRIYAEMSANARDRALCAQTVLSV